MRAPLLVFLAALALSACRPEPPAEREDPLVSTFSIVAVDTTTGVSSDTARAIAGTR